MAYDTTHRIVYALITTLVAILVFCPCFFKFVNSLTSKLGLTIAASDGLPNAWGLLVHGVVFFLLLILLMNVLPKLLN